MPDASTMDPAAILQRVDEIEAKYLHHHDSDLAWLCQQLRTALADAEAQTRAIIHIGQGAETTINALQLQLDAALADTRRVDFLESDRADVFCRVRDDWMAGTPPTLVGFSVERGGYKADGSRDFGDTFDGKDLRVTIDAAMAATPRETK